MKRIYWVVLFLFFSVSPLYSQQDLPGRHLQWQVPRDYHVRIDPNHELSGRSYYFEGARYFDPQTRLPWYYELIPVEGTSRYRVNLSNTRFKRLTGDVSLNDTARKQIGERIEVHSRLSFGRDRAYLQVYFMAVRRNPATGELQGVEDFDLNLERKDGAVKKSLTAQEEAVASSVLDQGQWIKLRIDKEGIYRIDYSTLEDLGMRDASSLALYGNSSGLLDIANDTTPEYRLEPIPIHLEKGSDGIFGKGDYILFFGRDPDRWVYQQDQGRFICQPHPYTGSGYYYLTLNSSGADRLENLDQPSGTPQAEVTTFPDYRHHEQEKRNLIQSGQQWFGEYFDVQTTRTFEFDIPNIIPDQPVQVSGRFVSRSAARSTFFVYHEQEQLLGASIDPVSYNFTGYYARKSSGSGSFLPSGDNLKLQVEYRKGTPSAEGWLDYLTVNAVRELRMTGSQMVFRHKGTPANQVARLHLKDASEGLEIWEVTGDHNTRRIDGVTRQGDELQFSILSGNHFRSFVAFNPEDVFTPEVVGRIENQDLHGMGSVDMLVVSKHRFLPQAERVADLHRSHDGLEVGVVTDQQIFNEFAAGKPDPSAVRNFVRMLYRRSDSQDSLKYLLLFGDGSYDNREAGTSPYLITYQSGESLHYSRSFVSDDFFGLLDATDHIEQSPSGLIDIGIGRFPVMETSEARQVVDKIERYLNRENWGPWLNNLLFAADDEDNNLHMRDADRLAQQVESDHPRFNIQKVYFDSYSQQITASGARYPQVNQEINEQINNGVLLFNYTGHGGEHHLAHERILTKDDIRSWSNNSRLPLFMTATCEFTRFDDPDYTSAGEEVFLKSDGGSIASFSTTRLVYASLNYALNRIFYDYVFEKDSRGNPLCLGEVMRLTKNFAGTSNNKRNFSLFGDPALTMLLGRYQVQADSLTPADTLKALDRVRLHGSVRNADGSFADDFGGTMHLRVYDKNRSRQTLNNDGDGIFQYQSRDNLLFSGKSTVVDGTFTSEWVVPRDILPQVARGKMIFFGQDQEHLARGSYRDHYVGGFSDQVLQDQQGPVIELYMNDQDFVSGGITDENPTLIASFTDSSGINTARSAAGHDITLTLDNNPQDQYVLNRYYQAEENDYQKGKLRYQLSSLDKGRHELVLKAWDINNNPSTRTLEFTVSESDNLQIRKVLNYPNPFTERTAFYFEHNRPDELLDVMIQILTVSGKLVKSIHTQVQTTGFRAGPIHWDGRDDFGDRIGRGVYVYKLKIRSAQGEIAEKIQKLVILK
ncbi:MAG: type IX secretion system sortase PorU [Bacteroidales bacterium]|nr:type IX secretion system sortase PorU [Bacteroidales bacterium]